MALRVLTPGGKQQMYELENRQLALSPRYACISQDYFLIARYAATANTNTKGREREDTRDIDAADRSMRVVVGRCSLWQPYIQDVRSFVPP